MSVAASEPILAESTRKLMSKPSFNVPWSLLREFEKPGLDKGHRGEFVSLLLLMLASDVSVAGQKNGNKDFLLLDFFKNLLSDGNYDRLCHAGPSKSQTVADSDKGLKTFGQAFENPACTSTTSSRFVTMLL